jgi:Tol biopolymer transport system component
VSLPPGARLGPYEVLAPLGVGGMGEVYSARDTRLDRQVALKLVLDAFVSDPDRAVRFEHEARTLASLNHPHIATLHGLEHVDGRHVLVMELAEGETLAERIARHPGGLPVEDAVQIARQIADALEAAHEKGIVHRDLKPANVKVSSGDVVKVLDFGLAKAMGGAAVAGTSAMNSPTMASPVTEVGTLMGTAAYMAPEQARGKAVDKRADIWAFGVVLHEMLTGVRLFEGETASDTIAAVLTREPSLDGLPAGVPAHVRTLLRRCLERDPRKRLRDIGEARLEFDQPAHIAPAAGPTPAAPSLARTPRAARTAAWISGVLGLALVVAVAAPWQLAGRDTPARVIQFDVPPLPGTHLQLSSRPAVAVSPQGSMLAFTASLDGETRLYLRRRGEVEVTEIPGTIGASDPAFSPDEQWIAFVTRGELVKVSTDGKTRVALAPVIDPRGLTWLDDQTIVASREVALGLSLVSAGGGSPRELTTPDRERGERTHRWPAVVPGGRAVLFTVGTDASPDDYNEAQIDGVIIATGERKRVLEAASAARITADGRLLFFRNGVLHAADFDARRLEVTSPPTAVLPGVEGDATTGAAHFSISAERTLAYVPGLSASGHRRLAWADRSGHLTPIDIPAALFNEPAVSPDGRRLAIVVGTVGRGDVWTYDMDRQLFSRFTFEGMAASPVWSADGQSIYYTAIDAVAQQSGIKRKRVDGSGDATVLAQIPGRAYLGFVEPKGRFAILMTVAPGRGSRADIIRVPLDKTGPPEPLLGSPALEYAPTVSPDGRWLAYVSTASGVQEVWVREMDGTGQWQISRQGGVGPRWSADGRELFFRRSDVQVAVTIDAGPRFRAGQERPLFTGAFNWRTEAGISYAVDPVTGRFLMILPPSAGSGAGIETPSVVRVIANWDR